MIGMKYLWFNTSVQLLDFPCLILKVIFLGVDGNQKDSLTSFKII